MQPSILFITRSLAGMGGMQRYTRDVIAGLRKNNCMVDVVEMGRSRWRLPLFCIRSSMRIIGFRGQYVHMADGALSAVLVASRFLRPKLKRSITIHGLDLTYPSWIYQWILRRALPCTQTMIAISTGTAAEAKRRGLAKNMVIIRSGIEWDTSKSLCHHESRSIDLQSPRLLLLGRQIPRKGTAWFLSSVLPELLKKMPHLHVTVAGDGPELPRVRNIVQAYQYSDIVTIVGTVTEAEKNELFRVSTLLIMPNVPVADDMEGLGLVCIEAMAHGLPVVASRLEGIVDAVVEGSTGLLFSPQDTAHCAAVIDRALRTPWNPAAIQAICQRSFNNERVTHAYLYHVFC